MKQLLIDQLYTDYPILFVKPPAVAINIIDHSNNEFPNGTQISIRDGWYKLIYKMCDIIDFHIKNEFPIELQDQVSFIQIKEKFGRLSVHINHGDDFIFGTILMAETLSEDTCEVCGKNDASIQKIGGWLQALCKKDLTKLTKEYEKRMLKALGAI